MFRYFAVTLVVGITNAASIQRADNGNEGISSKAVSKSYNNNNNNKLGNDLNYFSLNENNFYKRSDGLTIGLSSGYSNNGLSSGSDKGSGNGLGSGYSSQSNGYSSQSNGYSSESNGYSPHSNGYSSESNGYSSQSNGGSVSAAIQSKRKYEVIPISSSEEPAIPQIVEVDPVLQPVQVIFRSMSSPVKVQQIHTPGERGQRESTKSEDEPHRVVHEVLRPVIQEVREVIQPYRRVTQEIKPVLEEVLTLVAKGERSNGLTGQGNGRETIAGKSGLNGGLELKSGSSYGSDLNKSDLYSTGSAFNYHLSKGLTDIRAKSRRGAK